MTEITTTVKLDQNTDFVYEVDITNPTNDVLIRRGRTSVASQPPPGICNIKMDNSGGTYTPKAGGSAIRPMQGIQVVADSQDQFTGFVKRVFLHPSGSKQDMVLDCADWLWILSRTDISLPLMLDVRSDILASRIADLAEIGELVDNTRFKTDLTGYSDFGSGVSTRVTTLPMEGPAEMRTTGVADASDGWEYALDNAESGDKAVVPVYARAYQEADIGKNGVLNLRDDGGSRAVTAFTLTADWQRIIVTATFASTNPIIRVIGAAVSSFATIATGAVHATLFKNAIPRSFNNGQSRFSHVGLRNVKALRALQDAAQNELGGLVYVDGSGNLVFEDRHYRWVAATSRGSQGTIDETMVDVPYEENADDLIGLVELGFARWEEGEPGSTVFNLFPVPRAIPPNGSIRIEGNYGAMVKDFIRPTANTDYFIRSQPDSDTAGDDETGNATVIFQDFGDGFRAIIGNDVARTIHLTSYKIRATPIRRATDQPTTKYTPAGSPDYASELRYNYKHASNEVDVRVWGEYLGDRYVTQRERLPVKFVNKSVAVLAEMTDRVISERVTIINDATDYSAKVNADYHIDSVQHHLSEGKTKMETTWGVVPVEDATIAIWDSSDWDGAHVWAS